MTLQTAKMNTTRWLLLLLLLAAAGLATGVGIMGWSAWKSPNIVHLDLAFDSKDDRQLAGMGHNIFIARVTENLGEYQQGLKA